MEKTGTPWPVWMLRYVATQDPGSFEDLIWSVGGSPPYGGVSYEEASAVYDFLEQYRGPGIAPESAYNAVLEFAGNNPDAVNALEIFRCHDEVSSSPDSFTAEPVERGLKLSLKVNHTGAQATFLAYQSQIAHRSEDLAGARDFTVEALKLYLGLVEEEPAYKMRIAQTAQNAISFTAMSGDVDQARRLLSQLGDFIDEDAAEQTRRSLSQMG